MRKKIPKNNAKHEKFETLNYLSLIKMENKIDWKINKFCQIKILINLDFSITERL